MAKTIVTKSQQYMDYASFALLKWLRQVDTEIAKLLTGHSIGVRGRYLNYSDDDLLQEYLKALDLLTINETNRLRKEVDTLKQKEDEIESLKERLNSYDSQAMKLNEQIEELRRIYLRNTNSK
jgi:hypothetical protein